jgi:hypothetical protein
MVVLLHLIILLVQIYLYLGGNLIIANGEITIQAYQM